MGTSQVLTLPSVSTLSFRLPLLLLLFLASLDRYSDTVALRFSLRVCICISQDIRVDVICWGFATIQSRWASFFFQGGQAFQLYHDGHGPGTLNGSVSQDNRALVELRPSFLCVPLFVMISPETDLKENDPGALTIYQNRYAGSASPQM